MEDAVGSVSEDEEVSGSASDLAGSEADVEAELVCICRNVPKHRSGLVITPPPANGVVSFFHLDCPLHGIGRSEYRAMKKVLNRAWLNSAQAMAVISSAEEPRLLNKKEDGTAYVEWVTWEVDETQPWLLLDGTPA